MTVRERQQDPDGVWRVIVETVMDEALYQEVVAAAQRGNPPRSVSELIAEACTQHVGYGRGQHHLPGPNHRGIMGPAEGE